MTANQILETLPELTVLPLKGEVCSQYISCRKPECKCADGELHGPYYYRIWRDGSKVQKVYVKRSDVDEVRAACAAYKSLMVLLREQRQTREELARQITVGWRETKKLLKPQNKRAKSL